MPQSTQPHNFGGNIAETISYLEQEWATAAKAGDSTKVAQLLSDVFIEMDSDGSLRKKTELLDRTKADKWQVFEISDVSVVVNGSIAIATGAWRGKGTSADGKPIDAHEHWMDTWHKNGKWQCLASASAPVKM
jgi:ketosteroid isomerase-like protein